MSAVLSAFLKAVGQLGDHAILAIAAKSIGVTLLIFAGLGAGFYVGLAEAAARVGIAEGWGAVLAVLLLPAAIWLMFRLVAVAVLQFFADGVVAAVEARHYPASAARARPLSFHRDLVNAAKGLGRTIGYSLLALPVAGALAFTAIGPTLVLLGVNAVLLGREMTEMAWLRHCGEAAHTNPVPRSERILLGAAIAGLMLIPLANLAAPLIGAAAGTHLVLRRLEEQQGA